MNTAAFLEALLPDWRATLPPTIDRAYFDAFVARNRKQLEATLAPLVALLDTPTPEQRRQIADEEARMGVALRAARDDEERPPGRPLSAAVCTSRCPRTTSTAMPPTGS